MAEIGYREGCTIIDILPGAGPWKMIEAKIGNREFIVAASQDHLPRFYENGKLVDIFAERG